ncbi:MAG: helix-turn-helix domain-containing protein [Actinomycetota bacterium]|nr:helix-turn-helix domain-containing protein [Actinomycetota bacterium]
MITYSEQIAQFSTALADPTRREIMEHVQASECPLSVREVAEHFGLHANAARMHLEKLVKGGLLEIVRRRGIRGGRPAHYYRASDRDWDIHLPPRSYRLLAEVLAESIYSLEREHPEGIAMEAFRCGRKEAVKCSSPLAHLPAEPGIDDVANAWMSEIKRRGLQAKHRTLEDGRLEVTFLSCPFGELSSRYAGLVCEVHRLIEEGFLSMAGYWGLRPCDDGGCPFTLESNQPSS